MNKSGIEWNDALERELFTPQEIEENNMQARLICEIIAARQEQGYSQRDLEAMTGIKQSAIARMEKGTANPTLETIFKLLVPLGMTLAVVPLSEKSATTN